MNPQTPTPTPSPTPVPAPDQPAPVNETPPHNQPLPMATPAKTGGKKKLGLGGMLAAVIVALAGLSAAAYYGIILPNQPENKLAAAFFDLAKQDQMTISGKIDYLYEQSIPGVPGFAIDYSVKFDTTKSLLDLSGKVGIQGVAIPYDMRYVEQDIFMKVGGLSSLGNLLATSDSEAAAAYGSLLGSIDDQWYVIDRSFLQQAGSSTTCVADLSFSTNDEDIEKIQNAYEKYPLFQVKNTTSEDVDGVATTKYELDPADDDTAKKFANELKSMSIVEKINECTDNALSKDLDRQLSETSDDETSGDIYAYVTNDGKFKKMELTGFDGTSDTRMTMNFDFGDVTIEKPEGAKPIQDILNNLLSQSSLTTGNDALNTLVQ